MKRTCYILQVLAQFIILIRQCLAIDVVCQQVGRNGKKKVIARKIFAKVQKKWYVHFNPTMNIQKENFMIYALFENHNNYI